MKTPLQSLADFVEAKQGKGNKLTFANDVAKKFALTQDGKIYFCDDFAIRFSSSKREGTSFANTVLSLSRLQKFDDRPFVVCLVTPSKNHCFLANSTFLQKISHSSQELREDNIKGSFNGSDILRTYDGIENNSTNLDRLYAIHEAIGFSENLPRLVSSTHNIVGTGKSFEVSPQNRKVILVAPLRSATFLESNEAVILKNELDGKVEKFKNEILIASHIENVNIRGRIIEYLIAGEDEALRQEIIKHIRTKKAKLPAFKTDNSLGDYTRVFDDFHTETDVKTKIMIFDSNPKAYNIDKMLEFLSQEKSVFLFYFIGIDAPKIVNTILVSMFEPTLLDGTRTIRHWAGRNSRGVTQFEGTAITTLLETPQQRTIDLAKATTFLNRLIALP